MESNHVTERNKSENGERKSAKMGHTGINLNSAKDRWGKLKTTVAVTNQITTKKNRRLDRGDSFLRKFSTRNQAAETDLSTASEDSHPSAYHHSRHKTLKSFVIHPSGGLMFYWLGLVTLSVLYNLWTCIAREAFREIQKGYMVMWFCLDAACDCIYLCDIFVQFRTGYLQQGLMVYDSSKLCRNYLKDKCFIVDLSSLLPLDFLQFYTGIHPMLRFPRFLKLYRSVRFMHMYESRTAYPNLLRVASLSHILFLGSHWFAAFYYLISEAEGFEGDWSYPKPVGHYAAVTRKYLASLYWSTLTLTTIGDLPPPDTNWQYVFVIVSYLIGVFIFATIVGQVGNVITNRNASRQEFERLLDGAKFYMQMHNVPPDLQKRVQRWYDYVWTRGRLNCNDINSLGLLPDKLKTELALHVNLGTLKKVTIFQKCRPEFLHDLMLKMRAYIFTPGDLICRRGEVAREMFIIADGVVEILGENGTVLTQMSTGDFFGEIGILNLDGGINRRTADVRSVGYSELFVLSREDVLAALKDHPDAEEILTTYARSRLENLLSLRTISESNEESSHSSANSNVLQFSNEAFSDSNFYARKNFTSLKVMCEFQGHAECQSLWMAVYAYLKYPFLRIRMQIIREYGQRRLKETEEHRKMVRSTPSSPDPSSFRSNKGTNKTSAESTGQGGIHLPQVKCLQNLQKLPHMSPKLRKLFSLGNKRSKRRERRWNSESTENVSLTVPSRDVSKQETVSLEKNLQNNTDNGVKLPVTNLDIIQEKDHSDTEQEKQQEQIKSNTSGTTNLADLVLNLIKTRRQLGYRAVRSEETDADEHVENVPSGHIKDNPTDKGTASKVNYAYNDKNEEYTNSASEKRHQHRLLKRENAIDTKYDKKSSMSAPKIILTHESDQTSSESSSSESEKEDVTAKRTPTPFLPIRNHISRKSSPCILPIPSSLNDGTGRKYSCAPPLDLPIEVPSFSNFRGLSGSTQEISFSLDRFRSQIMQRMDNMESSNRETQIRLQETLMLQERMMKNILKRLPSKDKTKDEVVNVSDTTNVKSDAPRTSSGKSSAFVAYTTHSTDSGENSVLPNEPIYSNTSGQYACSYSKVLTNSCAAPDCSSILNKSQLVNNEMVDRPTETLQKSCNSGKQHSTSRDDSNENKKTMNKSIELFEDRSIFKLVTEHGEENIEYKVTHL